MSAPAKKILVVEDEAIAAKIISRFLSKLDCEIDVANNADEALEKASKYEFDLIIMDLGLGDGQKDGVEVTELILNCDCKNSHTPIVALTARDTDEDRDRCKAAGMLAYYVKPVSLKSISDMLEQCSK